MKTPPVSLDGLAETAAKYLPEAWRIEIQIENGYAGVYLFDPDGERYDMYRDEMSLEEQVVEAVRKARGIRDYGITGKIPAYEKPLTPGQIVSLYKP